MEEFKGAALIIGFCFFAPYVIDFIKNGFDEIRSLLRKLVFGIEEE